MEWWGALLSCRGHRRYWSGTRPAYWQALQRRGRRYPGSPATAQHRRRWSSRDLLDQPNDDQTAVISHLLDSNTRTLDYMMTKANQTGLNKLFWGNIELINHLVGIMAQLFYCTSILFSYKIMMAQLFKDRPKYYLDWRSSSFENEILDPNAAEACHGWLQPPYYALDHTLINVVEN